MRGLGNFFPKDIILAQLGGGFRSKNIHYFKWLCNMLRA